MAETGNYQAPADLNRIRTIALGVGGIGLIVWAIGAYFNVEQALRSWLLGFIFWGGIGIGGLGILLLQYLTGGAWGVVIRRTVEAASRTIPLLVVLFVPLVIGVFTHTVYEWTHLPSEDFTMVQRGAFQTPLWWTIRAVIYFALFIVMMYLLNKWSAEQDKAADHEAAARWLGKATAFSGPTMVIYALVVTFASVDWVMSLDPHWFSTIWGLLYVVGWALSTFCFSVVILAFLSDKAPMNRVLGKRHFHDIGKLMLALVMVWTYFNFSQYLIIWSGNIPEETGWYLTRTNGGWQYVAWFLLLFHFAVPFLILLQQDLKRRAKLLASIGLFILFVRLVDMFFMISPNPRIAADGESLSLAMSFSWLDIAGTVAVGGIWLWYFFGQLMKRPLVPVMDPFLENAIEHGHGH